MLTNKELAKLFLDTIGKVETFRFTPQDAINFNKLIIELNGILNEEPPNNETKKKVTKATPKAK